METEKEKELWKLAKKRVRFKRHLAIYLVMNLVFWLLWYFTDRHNESAGIPWPIFVTLGWGIGLMFSFLNAYVLSGKNSIQKEYDRLNRN